MTQQQNHPVVNKQILFPILLLEELDDQEYNENNLLISHLILAHHL